MKITVFGAAGRTGIPLIQQALAAGYEVVAFVRDPGKFFLKDDRLTVVQGDVREADKVALAIAGADAVISVIGQTRPPTPDLLTTAIGNIVTGMKQHRVRRLVYLTGAGVQHPNDRPGFADKVMGELLKLLAKEVLLDSEQAARAIQASDLDWVIVRTPRLIDGPAKGQYRSGYLPPGFAAIARADVADFMLKQVGADADVRQMPIVIY